MRSAQWLGMLGGLAALTASVVSLVIYGETIPYTDRIGYGIAAFFLAAVATTGGLLVHDRPIVGSALLVVGSMLGYGAMNLFSINTWYGISVLICVIAAVLALTSLGRSASDTLWRSLLLIVLAGGAIAGYFFGGLVEALAFGALFAAALALTVIRPIAVR